MRDVVKFVYAPNTVTNASAPAPVSSYQAANQKLTDVILEALAPFRPERALANSGSSGAMLISWKDGGRPGQPSLQYELSLIHIDVYKRQATNVCPTCRSPHSSICAKPAGDYRKSRGRAKTWRRSRAAAYCPCLLYTSRCV